MLETIENLPEDLGRLRRGLESGETISEISRETGIPRGTIYESIRKLRKYFEDGGLKAYWNE